MGIWLTHTQTTAHTPTVTPYDSVWTVSVAQVDEGSFANGMASGSEGTLDFAAQKQ